jgi:hypothetical protein
LSPVWKVSESVEQLGEYEEENYGLDQREQEHDRVPD